MGTDIRGVIERAKRDFRTGAPVAWRRSIALGELYRTRDYDAFGCLFGVRNFANFRPIAAERGLPADVSDAVRAEYDGMRAHDEANAFSATWVGWDELATVDWDEPAEAPDDRVHEFVRTESGELRNVGKAGWSPAVATSLGLSGDPAEPYGPWTEEREWSHGDRVFRTVVLRRRDAIPPLSAWQPVWDVMRALGQVHGDDGVRLVVWFDR
ncbi:hypothetical protein [Yinghuangia seranimata]|uniref:hypothetical protein n=1 Tax=Yinghuangia seranimata TaxID=408067 RepID=UPI00248CBE77|nr:hypothetical protein [Yinghuangia seranimata]MDI2126561.1 hypothetical protein [Yinghuangia seranimata]